MGIVKILIIVTNINIYASGNYPTGLWLSELTHIYDAAKTKGYDVTIASPEWRANLYRSALSFGSGKCEVLIVAADESKTGRDRLF